MKNIYFTSLLFLIGCSSSVPDASIPLADHLKTGMDFLDQEKYVKAQEEFQFILSRGTGTDYGDDAQFFLAESYFLNEQYILSIQEYENLTRKMSYSPFFEKARFRICEAYRIESPNYYNDQSYSEKALERYKILFHKFYAKVFQMESVHFYTLILIHPSASGLMFYLLKKLIVTH